jgi:hypothetical protein
MFDGLIDGRMDRQPTPEEGKKILKDAAALLRRGHTQRTMARDSKGYAVSLFQEDARSFCAIGAVTRAAYNNGFSTDQSWKFSRNFQGLMSTNDRMRFPFKGHRIAAIVEKLPVPA